MSQFGTRILISHSHRDGKWAEMLSSILEPMVKSRYTVAKVSDKEDSFDQLIDQADAVVLVATPSYLASNWIAEHEFPTCVDLRQKRGLLLFWLPVSASAWQYTPLREIQAVCDPSRPLDGLKASVRDEALAEAAKTIAEALGCRPREASSELRAVIVYKRHADPDAVLAEEIRDRLRTRQVRVFLDRDIAAGIAWSERIASEIREADAVVPLLSGHSVKSEMFAYEVSLALETAQQRKGKPRVLPIRVSYDAPLPESLASLNAIQHASWAGPDDTGKVTDDIIAGLNRAPEVPKRATMPVGGAVPLNDELYVDRDTDRELAAAVDNFESIVLIKGARQMGRTSLLARGLDRARHSGATVIYTDFQQFNLAEFQTLETLYRSLIEVIAETLDLKVGRELWKDGQAPNWNIERFIKREVLSRISGPVVWGMDEVDRLFQYPYASEFFGLIRTWHNRRSIKPGSEWERFTVVIAYATEPYLFIQDLNQSPFNVGVTLSLEDFTLEQVGLLNLRMGSPLKNLADTRRFYDLLGGQPFLVRRGLYELSRPHCTIGAFLEHASDEDGPFGDHLRRILMVLATGDGLIGAVGNALRNQEPLTFDQLYRLRRAGIFVGESPESAKVRCRLYEDYLRRHLLRKEPATVST